jgi:hypothetical protein
LKSHILLARERLPGEQALSDPRLRWLEICCTVYGQ